ncbi:phage minor head protein [Erythrobacter sp. EC-HK427]|uniref:phage minor head protein n=1 Tax=Erythrobacter sp. EC-HK427 TaxID=2038396 RepID=UPI00125FF7CC|nr:phage minor head protein [Erythrobacter sp. EC-HK427]
MIKFRDSAAESWLRTKSRSILEDLGSHWRERVQDKVADGLQRGDNPRKVGLELAGRINQGSGKREGALVELNEVERSTVLHFEHCLRSLTEDYFNFGQRDKRHDRSMRRALREGAKFPDEKIVLLVNRFESKLIKQKADLIAQTEMLAALNRSGWCAIRAAIERSGLPEQAVTRIWDTCGDERVRPSHKALDGQRVVGFDQHFVSPVTGARMMYPGDQSLGAPEIELVGCRCRVRYDINWAFLLT